MTARAGIVGLGRFGKLLYKIIEPDFDVRAYDIDESTHEGLARRSSLQEVASAQIVFLCVPINHLETVLLQIKDYLQKKTIVIDVCSVKLEPAYLMEQLLPKDVDILPAHPMFGPNAAANGTIGLPFVLCPTSRTSSNALSLISAYLDSRGFKVLQMTCDEHDRVTAYSLCVTQMIGRVLGRINLQSSASDTKAFRNLLEIREIALNDSRELFLNLQTRNPYAHAMRKELHDALGYVEQEIAEWHGSPRVF